MAGRLGFRWRQLAHDLRNGLLFRPIGITSALAGLALILVELERRGVITPFSDGGWFFRNDPGSAQTVLGAIGGSMMSVISIVYSVMLVALSLASVQFSPRILGSFVRDRVSQRTLGIFIGTFVYCLIVMRAVSTDPPWVGTWATAVGFLLGFVCLLALIYFIHHIATGIQVSNIVDRIGRETEEVIEEVYPLAQPTAAPPRIDGAASVVSANAGYLQLVDYDGLVAIAREHGVVVHVTVEHGDYVARGAELAQLAGTVPAAAAEACAAAFDVGSIRTMQQDVAFGVRQLVDIALKAISPAVNDPSTATICIDRLGSLLAEIGRRPTGERVLADGTTVRVVATQPTFVSLVDLAFNQLRQYGRSDLAVSIRLLDAIERAARSAPTAGRNRLLEHAELIRAGLTDTFLPADRARFDVTLAALRATHSADAGNG